MTDTPYRHLPSSCFWKYSVSGVEPRNLDPIVSVPFMIARDDKVATAGSCFAQHISRYLKMSGLTYLVTEPAHPMLNAEEASDYNYGTYTARYGNIYTARQLLQLFERAYGDFQPKEDVWTGPVGHVDPFRPQIQPNGFCTLQEFYADRLSHLAAVRNAFETLSVLIFTFGLVEGWESSVDGAIFPLCPGVAGGTFDAGRHRLHLFTVAEVVSDSLAFIDRLRSVNRNARIILTVSPVPLAATALAGEHVLCATTYAKSVLRVACAEIGKQRPQVAYVPSYEIITGTPARGRYFSADCRSVNEAGVSHVMRVFLKAFAGLDSATRGDSGRRDLAFAPVANEISQVVAANCEEIMLENSHDPESLWDASGFCCNLCGARDFGPGPGGRLTADGKAPLCRQCGSLERSRAVASIFQTMPADSLRWRKALLLGADQGVRKDWFKACDVCAWPGGSPTASDLHGLGDCSQDFVSLIHVLEFVEDDRAFFNSLVRLLSPTGVLQIRFMEPERRGETVEREGRVPGNYIRLYGTDLPEHFRCAEAGLAVAQVEGTDPHTAIRFMIHFFAKAIENLAHLPRDRFVGLPSSSR